MLRILRYLATPQTDKHLCWSVLDKGKESDFLLLDILQMLDPSAGL